MEHTVNIAYGLSKPTSRKLRERLEEILELAERLGAEVTVLPPSHRCYDNGYKDGCNIGYQSAEADAEIRRQR